jgi:hypothetical protein
VDRDPASGVKPMAVEKKKNEKKKNEKNPMGVKKKNEKKKGKKALGIEKKPAASNNSSAGHKGPKRGWTPKPSLDESKAWQEAEVKRVYGIAYKRGHRSALRQGKLLEEAKLVGRDTACAALLEHCRNW